MVFEPHLGRLAPRHQPESAPRPPLYGAAPRSVSVYAAFAEAARLFERRPLPALGLGGVWLAAAAAAGLAGCSLAAFAHGSSPWVSPAGFPIPDWFLGVAGVTTAFAAVVAPMLVGVCAAGTRSARRGAPTCAGLWTGFRHYGASFVLGAVIALACALLSLAPTVAVLLSPLISTFAWAVFSALADRRGGPLDALGAAFSLLNGRLIALVILNVCAALVTAVGAALVGLATGLAASAGGGLEVLVGPLAAAVILAGAAPMTALMLGVGYRGALEASGVPAAETEA